MNLSNAILILKDFFLEVLGFFLPGFSLLFLLKISLTNFQLLDLPGEEGNELNGFMIFFLAYVLGYIIYGLGLLIDKIFKCWSFKNGVFDEIRNSSTFHQARISLKKIEPEIESIPEEPRPLRNILMSYAPEADVKIYTFMFRSDLCFHIGILLFIVGVCGLIASLLSQDVFITNHENITLYIFMIASACFLQLARKRFFSIAHRLIYPIFIAKVHKIKE